MYDLHCHSTHSDGLLSPTDLVERAAGRGVTALALTDHDAVSGLAEAGDAARRAGIRLIPGTELSVSWSDHTLHVVGLAIDAVHPTLIDGLATIRTGRIERAHRMAESLARAGIPGAFDGAMRHVTNADLVSRTHFARYLVETGAARDMGEVFKRYLNPGKPGYVRHRWASLADAIGWIHSAGGIAVLAHPGRYRVGTSQMRALLEEFKTGGGDAIEVVTSNHTHAQVAEFTALARHFGFLASTGTDFHGPGESWMDFGQLPALPIGLPPVWTRRELH